MTVLSLAGDPEERSLALDSIRCHLSVTGIWTAALGMPWNHLWEGPSNAGDTLRPPFPLVTDCCDPGGPHFCDSTAQSPSCHFSYVPSTLEHFCNPPLLGSAFQHTMALHSPRRP